MSHMAGSFENLRVFHGCGLFLIIPKGYHNCQLFIVNCQLNSPLSIHLVKPISFFHFSSDSPSARSGSPGAWGLPLPRKAAFFRPLSSCVTSKVVYARFCPLMQMGSNCKHFTKPLEEFHKTCYYVACYISMRG